MEPKDRKKWERQLSKAYYENAEDFKERLRIIIRKNGGWPQGVDAIPWTVWEEYAGDLKELFDPLVYHIFMASAKRLAYEAGADFSWFMVNRRAAEYAREYSYGLVKNITDTDRDLLADAVNRYYYERMTLDEAVDIIEQSPAFGRARAELIAITEVTRTSVAGEYLQAQVLNEQGWDLVPVWKTRYDEMVCPVCGPRNGVPRLDEWTPDGWTDPPPAHPRCRCWLNWMPRSEVGTLEKLPPLEPPKPPEMEDPGTLPTPDKMPEIGFKKYVQTMLPDSTIKINPHYHIGDSPLMEKQIAEQLYSCRQREQALQGLPNLIRIGYKGDFSKYSGCPAWADWDLTMAVNAEDVLWSDTLIQKQLANDWWVSGSTMQHEMGHIAHYRFMQNKKFFIRDKTLFLHEALTAQDHVSGYAGRNSYELVAETFHGLVLGKQYPQEMLALYKRYGGPPIEGVVEYTQAEIQELRKRLKWPEAWR